MPAQLYPSPSLMPGNPNARLPRRFLLIALMTMGLPMSASAQSESDGQSTAGPLDTPVTASIVVKGNTSPDGSPAREPSNAPDGLRPTSSPSPDTESLKAAVREEQDSLEQLPRATLSARAQRSERAAQIALGVSFAKEAALLGFSVAAANSAASDAARWYHRAASQGFPGAPSLDTAGVRHYPIRASRTSLE